MPRFLVRSFPGRDHSPDGVDDRLPASRSSSPKGAGELDARVKEWRDPRLAGDWQYLFLDAAWAKGVTAAREAQMLGFERVEWVSQSSQRA